MEQALNPLKQSRTNLAKLIEEDELKPLIDSVFPFSEEGLREAHEKSQTGHAKGKIVIEIVKVKDKKEK